MTFLQRYQRGEYADVWRELQELGDTVREMPYFEDAWAVAQETMHRVRHNVETIYRRLLSIDYRFVDPDSAYVPPSTDVEQKLAAFEARVGAIPLSVRAWFRYVGKVDFRGSHPVLSGYYPLPQDAVFYPEYRPHEGAETYPYYSDPIYFPDIEEALALSEDSIALQELEAWFCIPDWFTKANVSGSAYFIRLPGAAADARFENEPHLTTFVDYLRTAFRWGGFPGFELHTAPRFETWREKWHMLPIYPEQTIPYDMLRFLSAGLQAI